MSDLLRSVRALVEAGFSLIPCAPDTKLPIGYLLPIKRGAEGNPIVNPRTGRPTHTWKDFRHRLPTEEELQRWFGRPDVRPAVVNGVVSGHAELLDFDKPDSGGANPFQDWYRLLTRHAPELAARLCIVRTPSGAHHVPYRCPELVIPTNHVVAARHWHPTDSRHYRAETPIETRGEGGYALCPPGAGYSYLQGSHLHLPVIGSQERDLLHQFAILFATGSPRPAARPAGEPIGQAAPPDADTPWERYNQRATNASILALFARRGWRAAGRDGEGRRVRRPGAASESSGTVGLSTPGWFHCFSSNAAPFEAGRNYSPFQVLALLEHGGDTRAAARALWHARAQEAQESARRQGTIVQHPMPGEICAADPGMTFRRIAGLERGSAQ